MKGYTIREAAKILNMKVRTIRDWLRKGKIKAEKKTNDWYWMIPEVEIERLRNGNTDAEHTE